MKISNIRKNKLIFFYLFFFICPKLICNEPNSQIPSNNTSNPIGIESNWIGNPLNLSFTESTNQILIAVTPSKFLLPDLNVYTLALCKKEFLSINASSVLNFIHSKIFSNFFINLSINKHLFENYNLALRLSSEIISVRGFKPVSNFSADILFEYLFSKVFRVGCNFQNLMFNYFPKKIGFGASYVFSEDFFCGLDMNIHLKEFTSYKFVSTMRLIDNLLSEIMYSTNPSIVNLLNELEISDLLKLILSIEYNTKLGISQTIAIQLCF